MEAADSDPNGSLDAAGEGHVDALSSTILGSPAQKDAVPPRKRALSEGGDPKSQDDPEKSEKRARRLVKNREAAQQFRQRQKQHILDMEQKIKLLDTENVELRNKVELLAAENKIVKDQLMYLRSFIGQAVNVSLPAGGIEKLMHQAGQADLLGKGSEQQ